MKRTLLIAVALAAIMATSAAFGMAQEQHRGMFDIEIPVAEGSWIDEHLPDPRFGFTYGALGRSDVRPDFAQTATTEFIYFGREGSPWASIDGGVYFDEEKVHGPVGGAYCYLSGLKGKSIRIADALLNLKVGVTVGYDWDQQAAWVGVGGQWLGISIGKRSR